MTKKTKTETTYDPELHNEKLTVEVDEFLQAQERYFRWQQQYPQAYKELLELQSEYNATRDAAEKILRAHGKSEGPFVIKNSRLSYDAEKLYDEVGKERFLELGGEIATSQTFKIDSTTLQSKIASKKLDPAIVEAISKPVHVFDAPKKLNVT